MTVNPIIDYEPPARAAGHGRPVAPARLRCARPPQPGRSPLAAPSPAVRAAAAFAEAALRRVLEVIDQRRPAAHLYPLLTPDLADSVLSAHSAQLPGASHSAAATLQRVRLQITGFDEPPTAAEVFGTYRRLRHIHAVACRIERMAPGPGWRITALHIG